MRTALNIGRNDTAHREEQQHEHIDAKEPRTEYMKRLHANGGEQSEPTSGHIHCGTAPKPQSEATKADLPACVSPWGSRMRHEDLFVERVGDRR